MPPPAGGPCYAHLFICAACGPMVFRQNQGNTNGSCVFPFTTRRIQMIPAGTLSLETIENHRNYGFLLGGGRFCRMDSRIRRRSEGNHRNLRMETIENHRNYGFLLGGGRFCEMDARIRRRSEGNHRNFRMETIVNHRNYGFLLGGGRFCRVDLRIRRRSEGNHKKTIENHRKP